MITREQPGMIPPPPRFDYLMLRLVRSDADTELISGLAEALRTGEKRSFETGDQLLQLIAEWSGRNAQGTVPRGPAP